MGAQGIFDVHDFKTFMLPVTRNSEMVKVEKGCTAAALIWVNPGHKQTFLVNRIKIVQAGTLLGG